MDNNAELARFCSTLEAAVIKTVENGKMTKDLAMCISEGKPVERSAYRTTQEFMQDIADCLAEMWGTGGRVAKL